MSKTETPFYVVPSTGPEHGDILFFKNKTVVYRPNNKTIDHVTDETNGNRVWYQADGKTVAARYDVATESTLYYKKDGKTVDYITRQNFADTDYYAADGKTRTHTVCIPSVPYMEDGKTVHYQAIYYKGDGQTRDHVIYADGKEVYYKKDGKTIDYQIIDGQKYDRDGIRWNMLAESRKALATGLKLNDVRLPREVRAAEAALSDKLEKNAVLRKIKDKKLWNPVEAAKVVVRMARGNGRSGGKKG